MATDLSKISANVKGKPIDRRQIVKGIGVTATAAFAAAALPDATGFAKQWAGRGPAFAGLESAEAVMSGSGFKALAYNHIDYRVPDYAKVRDFFVSLYSMKCVWDDGKQCSVEFGDPKNALYIRTLNPGDKEKLLGPSGPWSSQMGQGMVNHMAISVENFQLDSVKVELDRRGLNPQPDGPFAWTIHDPSGNVVQICATKGVFPGQANPAAKESDGLKNLSAVPKPDGSGFKAYAVNHLVMMVPDVEKARDFYIDLLGMKLVYYKPGDYPSVESTEGPVCFLRFAENYLYIRRSQHPEHKSYYAHFAPTVENFDQAKVKEDLQRRGFQPTPDSKFGWSIKDPAGMRIEVAGKGLPEHVGGDCDGGNARCPGGPDK
jgi:catechol 2,3-dioxygenase-like lactoylglutathione lyase family enzyme